jgi:DNA-binding transcriptional LysR family regulator
MAQPPLSRHIKALEDELGVALFVRTPKGMQLTEAGRVLADGARHLLALCKQTAERTRLAGQGMTGRLDVGLFGSGVLDVIPRLLARFHSQRPHVRIVLHNLTKAEQLQALRERRIAVGFNRLVPPEPDIAVETLLREPLVVALPEKHPLAQHLTDEEPIALSALDGVPMILYPNLPLHGLAHEVRAAFQVEGVRLHVEQEVEDVMTAVALVAAGFGAAITTRSATNLRLPGVIFRPLQSRALGTLELCCLWRRDDQSPVLAAFLESVRSHDGSEIDSQAMK